MFNLCCLFLSGDQPYQMMLIEFNSNTMGVTNGVEADYPSSAPEFTPDVSIVRVAYLFSFLCYYVFYVLSSVL